MTSDTRTGDPYARLSFAHLSFSPHTRCRPRRLQGTAELAQLARDLSQLAYYTTTTTKLAAEAETNSSKR